MYWVRQRVRRKCYIEKMQYDIHVEFRCIKNIRELSRNFLIYKIEDDKIKVDVCFDTQ